MADWLHVGRAGLPFLQHSEILVRLFDIPLILFSAVKVVQK
jgi:hypothetical protein